MNGMRRIHSAVFSYESMAPNCGSARYLFTSVSPCSAAARTLDFSDTSTLMTLVAGSIYLSGGRAGDTSSGVTDLLEEWRAALP